MKSKSVAGIVCYVNSVLYLFVGRTTWPAGIANCKVVSRGPATALHLQSCPQFSYILTHQKYTVE